MSKMLRIIRTKIQGFTLIELLAVMAIIAVLASIVSVSVSGSGQTSRDAQVQEDANSAGSAVADFFDDQPITEVFKRQTVTVLSTTDIHQEKSNRWPEEFITEFYETAFEATNDNDGATNITPTVNSIAFLNEAGKTALTNSGVPEFVFLSTSANSDGSTFTVLDDDAAEKTFSASNLTQTSVVIAGDKYDITYSATGPTLTFKVTDATSDLGTVTLFSVKDLLTKFNALDMELLDDGGYATQIPNSFFANSTVNAYPNYLWLMEKDKAIGSTGTVNSRNVAAYVLVNVVETSTADKFDLTFQRLE